MQSYKSLVFTSQDNFYLGFFSENDEDKETITSFKAIDVNKEADSELKDLKKYEMCSVLVKEQSENVFEIYSVGKIAVLDDDLSFTDLDPDELFSISNDLMKTFPKTGVH